MSVPISVFDQMVGPGIHTQLVNEFYLSPLDVLQLDKHFILHWTGQYLRDTLGISQIVSREEIDYIPIFQGCTRNKLLQADQLKLSFRKHFNPTIPPYVLVRIL